MIQIRWNNHDSQAKGKVLLGEFNDTVIQLMSLMDKKQTEQRKIMFLCGQRSESIECRMNVKMQ